MVTPSPHPALEDAGTIRRDVLRRRSAACFGRPGEPEALLALGPVGGPGSEREECAIVRGRAERLAALLEPHPEAAVGFGALRAGARARPDRLHPAGVWPAPHPA